MPRFICKGCDRDGCTVLWRIDCLQKNPADYNFVEISESQDPIITSFVKCNCKYQSVDNKTLKRIQNENCLVHGRYGKPIIN